ncbi:MAG: spore coat associated protein CotJA [Clostridia bacterium]|nr:spore coat associated protein CotJA [Clostridia bacterium]
MYICNSCRIDGTAECFENTVAAGDAAKGLAGCGYETAAAKLPRLIAENQRYSSGLCPDCALEKGTMFPELVSVY